MKKLIVKNISIKNFQCHKEMEFDFSKNRFVIITGANGSGKTSIFDALTWAFYDETTKGKKGDSVVTKRVDKNCSVVVEFDIDGDQYRIENYRKHKTHKNNKFIFKNNKDITRTTTKETNKLIEDIILPKDIFMNCLLFSHLTNKNFTDLPHSEQKDLLDKLLSFDKFEEYQQKVVDKIKEIENEIKLNENKIPLLESAIEHYNDYIGKESRSLEDLKDKYQNYLITSKDIITELKKYIEDNEYILDEIKKVEDKIDTYKKEYNTLLEKISGLELSVEREINLIKSKYENEFRVEADKIKSKEIEKIDSLKDLCRNLETKIANLKVEYSEKKSAIENNIRTKEKESLKDIDNEIAKYQTEMDDYNSKIIKEDMLLSSDKISSLENEIKSIDSILKSPNPVCRECGQILKDEEEIKRQYNSKIETLQKELADEIAIREQSRTRLSEYKNHKENITTIITNLKCKKDEIEASLKAELLNLKNSLNTEFVNEKASIEEEINNHSRNIESMVTKINSELQLVKDAVKLNCERDIEAIKSKTNAEIIYFKSECSNIDEVLKTEQSELNRMSVIREKLSQNKVLIDSKKEEINRNVADFEDRMNKIKLKIKEIQTSDISQKEEEISIIKSEINKLSEKLNISKFWKEAFSDRGIKAILLDECIPIMNMKARDLSSSVDFLKVNFDSQSTITSGELRDKFTINVVQTRNLSELSELSAGERRIANIIVLLSLRHLLEVMNNISINILLLDEILDSIDSENSVAVMNMIRESCEDKCVVLISHTHRDYIEVDENLRL